MASCSRCASVSAPWEVWGARLCNACHGAWLATPSLRVGEHWPHAVEHFTPEGHARYVAEATRRTALWVKEARRG